MSAIDTSVYATSYGQLISNFSNPVCPTSSAGDPQVYDPANGQCVSIPAAKVLASGPTAAACGGAPFQTQIDGKCYSTNSCPASSNPTSSCLNTQHVPYRTQPLAGPGVLANSMYGPM